MMGSKLAIKSHLFGTYLTACEDKKTVRLQVADPGSKGLPENCLWTMEKPLISPEVRFKSCHDKTLSREFIRGNTLVLKTWSTWRVLLAKSFYTGWLITRKDDFDGVMLFSAAGSALMANEDCSISVDNYALYGANPKHFWDIITVTDEGDLQAPSPSCSGGGGGVGGETIGSHHHPNQIVTVNNYPPLPGPNGASINPGPYCNSGSNYNESGTQITGDTSVKYEFGKQKIYLGYK